MSLPKSKEVVEVGFIMHIQPEVLAKLREEFPPGTKVVLDSMNDPYRDMPAGLTGEVMFIDDAGGAHIAWSNGSTLACLHGIDRFHKAE